MLKEKTSLRIYFRIDDVFVFSSNAEMSQSSVAIICLGNTATQLISFLIDEPFIRCQLFKCFGKIC